jgi:ribosomal 50S subunit-associated protein YjgA (DUF615 family)
MTSDEIVSRYGLLHVHAPMPEEIERAISEARRLRARAFRETAATWLARVVRSCAVQPAHASSTPSRAHTA